MNGHDVLCPTQNVHPDDCKYCLLLARVREDERAAALRDAVEAVNVIGGPRSTRTGLRPVYAEIVAAIEALGGER